MKAKIPALAFFTTLLLAGAAHAECSRPPEPTIPDGTTAEQQAMIDSKNAVQTYIEETEAYLDCLESEESDAKKTAKAEERELTPEEVNSYVTRYNAAVDSMKVVAEKFNSELRVYLDTQNSDG